jgi:hypothetical protein
VKVTRAGLLVVSCLAIFSVAGIRARSSRYTPEPELTFAHLADAHLFEEGGEQPPPETYRLATDNWKALHWSIDRINTLARSGKQIDFVVYTGDLGLENVAFSDSKACPVKAVGEQEGLPLAPERSASDKLVAELDRLTVRTVFFVSGNNDAPDQVGRDGRFECFLLRLQEKTQVLNRPLRIQELGPDHCFALKGFRLLGLSSATVDKTASLIRAQVPSGEPTLLFTQVPDLNDPSRQQPAWDLEPRVRREWENEAGRPNILGIFAGHFGDSTRHLDGNSGALKSLALDSAVAAKTYLAPPLAVKNQLGKPAAARGFLLVTANRTGVSSSAVQRFESKR